MRQRVIDDAIVQEMASDLGFDSRAASKADIPSMDIPATWIPEGVKLEDIIPDDAVDGKQANQPDNSPENSIPAKEDKSAAGISTADAPAPQQDDDLDVRLEEFFEDTFKES